MLSTTEIVRLRPRKNVVNPQRPQAFFVESEHSLVGSMEQVATILLTGRECVFHCLMCDLWKNTLDSPTPIGAIPEQIDYALGRLPSTSVLKLYNSSNFFDPLSVPIADYSEIIQRAKRFTRVIVENHPRLCSETCRDFAQRLKPTVLEIAMGLETVNDQSLRALNKQMTVQQFETAVQFLRSSDIAVRAFLLLRLPGMSEDEGVEWALRSVRAAFDMGVQTCSVIPTRAGNGAMEWLESQEQFSPPTLRSLEVVLEESLKLQRGRVFADLWDVERLCACVECRDQRVDRLRRMNLTQHVPAGVHCARCNP